VTGWSSITPYAFGGQEAFRHTDAGGMVSVTPGARPAFGYDINAAGDVTGEYEYEAFRTVGTTIEILSEGLEGNAAGEDINASGQVALTQENPDEHDAWRWSPGVGLEDLGLASEDERIFAHAINTAGDVVGKGSPAASADIAAGFVFSDGLGSINLNELLTGPGVQKWFIAEAWDINDAGQIVADALNLRTGKHQAVRLDPVP